MAKLGCYMKWSVPADVDGVDVCSGVHQRLDEGFVLCVDGHVESSFVREICGVDIDACSNECVDVSECFYSRCVVEWFGQICVFRFGVGTSIEQRPYEVGCGRV